MSKNPTESLDYEAFTHLASDEVLDRLSSSLKGLTSSQVEERRKQYGLNVLKPNQTSWLTIFLRQFKSPFIYILIGAARSNFPSIK